MDLALIGGTGLYDFPELEEPERILVETPYGPASAPVVVGSIAGRRVGFLARHGIHHQVPPHRINYRANLWSLHHLGAKRIVGINAVGGITAPYPPGTIAVPHQLIDYTWGRISTFADEGSAEVRHVEFSEPYDRHLRHHLVAAVRRAGLGVVDGGVYAATQGPRLETAAEIERLARDGADVVGMTGMPEAVLARELAVPYACLALVVNWAAGRGGAEPISMQALKTELARLTAFVPRIVQALAELLPTP
ncbi:MAG: putative S-methyl-5'-thioinosine phosphorylase [Lysobacterales bacterium]|jgi:5'-methylthioinosine phosphorylase|nr:MAG: putative S-methyl-5'-thioinosine phosphorylase [Xanthomonadales bacterium]